MKKPQRSLYLVLFTMILSLVINYCSPAGRQIRPSDLRCEYLVHPLGVDVLKPRFSWIITSPGRNVGQSAYRIRVSGPGGEKVWDSGKIISDKTTGILYRGAPLQSNAKYTWNLTVWDRQNRKSTGRAESWFQTGLLFPGDWKAHWIKAADSMIQAPLLRKEFTVEKKIKQACVYVTAMGNYELYLNGKKVGDHLLDPARTDFRKKVLYASYDVSGLLVPGANVAGIILGNGTYRVEPVKGRYGWQGREPRNRAPSAFMQLEITYTDGSQGTVITDESWKSSSGPITFNHVYGGEDYDARLEKNGWTAPGYDDTGWMGVLPAREPGVVLKSQMIPPIKVMQTLQPVARIHDSAGYWVFDMGQNFPGWWRIHVRGNTGTTIRVRGAETLNDSLFPKPLQPGDRLSEKIHNYHARVWTDYTLKGEGTEVYEPRFFYTGYRYVEVTSNHPGDIDSLYVEGRVVHTALEEAGKFESSDTLLNAIWRAAVWAQKGNLHGVPTDCPHREKGAYTGDGELIAETSMHDFRMASFYTKWMGDMRDSQYENGRIPNTAPTLIGGYGGGIAWGSAYILLPWWMYRYYADTVVMAGHYGTMKKYLAYLYHLARADADTSEPYIIDAFGGYWDSLGEWCAPGQSDGPNHPVVNTAYFYLDVLTFSKMAEVLGYNRDAARYRALADTIKQAFNRRFFDARTRLYGTDSLYQTYQVLALATGLVPDEYRKQVLDDLVRDIMVTHRGHLNTGIIGTKYLWPVLALGGRPEVAYSVIHQTTYPGYGFWMTHGATTLWEKWEGTHSHNHQMFGTVSEFFYKYLAGIRSPMDEGTTTGYKHILIRPFLPGTLNRVSASLETIHGKVRSAWEKSGTGFMLHVEIPANCDASVSVPVAGLEKFTVTESGRTVWDNNRFRAGVDGITGAVAGKEYVTFSTGSGKYDFVLSLK